MPIITLTTDFGLHDYIVGAIKGQLYSVSEKLTIVDISHNVDSYNYPLAAYFCNGAFKHFPDNTLHIVLVNIFDKKPEQILLAYHNKQYIACADNGLLTMILNGPPQRVVGLPIPENEELTTLNFTKVIANALTELLKGKMIDSIGIPGIKIEEKLRLQYVIGATTMEGQILYIDHFENVIVNITKEDFERERNGRKFKIVFKRDEVIDAISETYASVPQGEKVAIFNAAGYLEIAINKGNAAGLFGFKGFTDSFQKQSMAAQAKWYYQTVKIFFE